MRRPLALLALPLALALGGGAAPARALNVVALYADGPTEGFNDPTLGAARRNAFEYALSLWACSLRGSVTVVVRATFDPLGGTPTSATLGAASPEIYAVNFPNVPVVDTYYAIALANSLAGSDLDPGFEDIDAFFNSDVDGDTVLGTTHWYYGTDGQAGSDVDFVTTVLHELGHGLGFVDLIDSGTGAWLGGIPGIFSRNLFRGGAVNLQFDAMSNVQRLAAITAGDSDPGMDYTPTGEVVWNGAFAVVQFGGNVPMYAPDPYEGGSSISHQATEIASDPLMEPFDTGPAQAATLTTQMLRDMGWKVQAGCLLQVPATPPWGPMALVLAIFATTIAMAGWRVGAVRS